MAAFLPVLLLERFIKLCETEVTMKCDVLVVGASAAGMMAAISAAELGSEVILLDRDLSAFDHAANTIFEGMAHRAGIQIEESHVKKSLSGMKIISPGGHKATLLAKGYFIDRTRFDEHYLGMAKKRGVLLLQDTAKDMTLHSGSRMVAAEDAQIEARVVIDASGVQSALNSSAGLSYMRHPQDIAWAMEATVQYPGLGEEDFFQYWIGSMAPGWKATFSPAGGDLATIGVFVRGHGRDVSSFFQMFLKRFKAYKTAAYENIEQLKILSSKVGGDPIAVLPGEIVSDSFMVTGGAAGQSGLAYSMRAGIICGTVASQAVASGDVSKSSLSKYVGLWDAKFEWEYRMGRASLETLKNMGDGDIDRLVDGLSGKDILSGKSFWKEALSAIIKIASTQPKIALDLAINLAKC
jgi:digeranylgeranylglycerophospholipid reductase